MATSHQKSPRKKEGQRGKAVIKTDISEEAKLHVPWGYAKEPQNVLLKFLVGASVRGNSGKYMHHLPFRQLIREGPI